jgi:N-acetylglucosaminyldiphosphoundecaprenol N-acetyl-beta-D-mannosaminyltransferase
MVDLCRLAAANNWKVLFIGGRGGVARRALDNLKKRFPGLEGIAEDGPTIEISNDKLQMSNQCQISNEISKFTFSSFRSASGGEKSRDNDGYIRYLVERIQKEKIQLVFIGLGAPKQEYLMENFKFQISNFKLRHTVAIMVVGGAFDMLAGNVQRAPKIVQTMGFEWLWRLFQEPWRWKRQTSLLTFFRMVLFQKN